MDRGTIASRGSRWWPLPSVLPRLLWLRRRSVRLPDRPFSNGSARVSGSSFQVALASLDLDAKESTKALNFRL